MGWNPVKKLSEGSYFIRLAVSFLALATLALVVSLFIIYKNYENETIKENKTVSEQMLSQTVYGADMIWDWASMHAIELYNNGFVFNAMYGENVTQIDEMNAQTVLSYAMSSNPYIYSIYLYNGSLGKVFSTLSKGYSTDDFFDPDIIGVLQDKPAYSQYHFIPRKINFVHYDKNYEEDVISLIVAESLSDSNPANGALILNIKVSTIKNLIESYTPENGNYFIIFDDKGKVVSHTNPGMFRKDLSKEVYIQKIEASVKSSGYFTDTVGGIEYLITYVKSDKLKWSFVRMKPYMSLFEKTHGMRSLILILVLLAFLVIIFFSLWLSWKFYKPYNKAVENSNSFRKQYNDSKGLLRREFLKNLLMGEAPYFSDVRAKFRELDIKLDTGSFAVLILRIDDYRRGFLARNSEKDAAIYKFAICNIAQEILSARYPCEAVDMGGDTVAVVFNPVREVQGEEPFVEEEISGMVAQIRKALQEYFGICISGALGQKPGSLSELSAVCRNALEVSDYRLVYGSASMIFYRMVFGNMNKEYTYSDDMENDIVNCLKLRSEAMLEARIHEFFSIVGTLSYDDILMSVNRLAYASIKAINGISGKKSLDLNYKSAWSKIEWMDTLDEIRGWFLELYKTFMEKAADTGENIRRKHVDKVLDIIRQEYCNPNLSTDELANRLGLSSNYLREIFREFMGVTLANYITEFRCEKAGDMLTGTTLSIAEISEKIGLSNQNYFFTLFKKFKGMTPQQYRNLERDRDTD